MPVRRWTVLLCIAVAVGCASAAVATTNVRQPLGAYLTPKAPTGAPVPLRFDSSSATRIIRPQAADLPPATYSPVQAEHGEAVFKRSCAMCHAPAQFIGQQFVESWNDRRLFDFYALVRATMPLNNPGGLKEDEYLGVLAYLLKANHAPVGPDSLRPDTTALRGHKIAVHLP
jgi:mono/diheme cytochrome c family protein